MPLSRSTSTKPWVRRSVSGFGIVRPSRLYLPSSTVRRTMRGFIADHALMQETAISPEMTPFWALEIPTNAQEI